ncbi:MAG: hypothetical protein SF051_07465, partial [Elusimicrobiota bacterium]|nr:hypothetical protein [Elusimicrobiota bacterium]
MLKKSLATTLSAALILVGPGRTAVLAAGAITRPVAVPRVAAPTVASFNSPVFRPLTAGTPLSAQNLRLTPTLQAAHASPAPRLDLSVAGRPAGGVAAADAPTTLAAVTVAAEAVAAPDASPAAQTGALDGLYEGKARAEAPGMDAVAAISVSEGAARLSPAAETSVARRASVPAVKNGGLLLEVGVGAAVIALAALVSKPFRDVLARVWNATLGKLSLFAKKAETPEVLAQRILDQLNAAKPVYNRKVQEASTLVEKLKLQIDGEKAKVADLETSITALLSDS